MVAAQRLVPTTTNVGEDGVSARFGESQLRQPATADLHRAGLQGGLR